MLIVGLLLIWIYDKIGGTFLPRPWKIVLLIIFAILAAQLAQTFQDLQARGGV